MNSLIAGKPGTSEKRPGVGLVRRGVAALSVCASAIALVGCGASQSWPAIRVFNECSTAQTIEIVGDGVALGDPVPPGSLPQRIESGDLAEFTGMTFQGNRVELYIYEEGPPESWPRRGVYSLDELPAESSEPSAIRSLTLTGDLCSPPEDV